MTNDEDYYDILGVEPNASIEQIKDAYLYKANILHPDRLAAMTEKVRSMAERDLKMVNAAYEVLSNPKRRQEYDRVLSLKGKRKAVILAHNYQLDEVQDIADFVGDFLNLK